jgi:hypothetical protein
MKNIAVPAVRTLSVFAPLMFSGVLKAAPPPGTLSDTPVAVKALSQDSLSGVRYGSGSIESILAARGANYYSQAEKPNGYAAHRASLQYSTIGTVTAEDIEDKDVVPIESLRLPFYVSLYAGYTDNLYVEPSSYDHSTAYFGAGIRTFQIMDRGKFQGYFGVSLDNFILEDSEYSRSGGDSYLKDFTLHTGGQFKFSDSVALTTRSQYDFTSFGTLGAGVARPGVLNDDILRYNSDIQLRYRFDGKSLYDPGVGLATGLSFTGFDERGSNYGDFYRAALSQELAWNPGGPLTYYAQGRAGLTDFRDLSNYDGEFYAGLLGIRGTCPNCGLDFDVAAGAERWSYDYTGLRDRTSFRAEASVEGRLTDNLGLRFTGSYGIQSLLPNAGTNFIDAKGFRGQLRLNYQPSSNLVLGLYGEYQNLDGDIHRSSSGDLKNYVLGADFTYRLSDNIALTPGIMWINQDNGGPDSDAIIGTIRTTFTF